MHKIIKALILPLLFVSCETSENNYSNIDGNSFRVKKESLYKDGEHIYLKEYFYNNTNLSLILKTNKVSSDKWIEASKTEITYSNGKAIIVNYSKESEEWKLGNGRREFLIIDEQVLERKYIDKNDVTVWTSTYDYKDDTLRRVEMVDIRTNDRNIEFEYEEGLLKYKREYFWMSNNWELLLETEYNYSNYNLINWISTQKKNGAWELDYKKDFHYINNNISEIKSYNWHEHIEDWFFSYSYKYDYNDNGYLIEMTDDEGYLYVYEYENRKGNASLFINPSFLEPTIQ